MREKLREMGYTEIKNSLFVMEINKEIKLYHDYRKGKRWSYAFKGSESINVKELDEYKIIKVMEESNKCKTLDKW